MSSKRNPGSPSGDRVARAAALIRALAGVVDASIEADGGTIRAIAVVADPSLSAWEITRNVQSALLASLDLSIDMAIVEVTRPASAAAAPHHESHSPIARLPRPGIAPRNGSAKTNGNGAGKNGKGALPGPNAKSNGKTNGKRPNPWLAADGHAPSAAVPQHDGSSNGHAPAPFVLEQATSHAAPAPARPAGTVARLELDSKPGGRVGCRAVVATSDRIAAGEAEALDTPAGRLDAAARAVIAASPVPQVDLDAVRLLELAGRKYVIAAVRSWSGRETLYRAEVAAVEASPEAAAAQATLAAILK